MTDDRNRASRGLQALRSPGIAAALASALLFGAGTPLSKGLLSSIDPWLLAGLLYLGSGLGLATYRLTRRMPAVVRLTRREWLWLTAAVVVGGVVAPVLLMVGLTRIEGSSASLLLNAEGVFTALLAWFAFGENFDSRIAAGMLAIVAGTVVMSWPGGATAADVVAGLGPALAVLGACFAWALDNNFTRKVSLADPTWIACIKGLAAGMTNLLLAFTFSRNAMLPPIPIIGAALILGSIAYGVSLSLFVFSLRHLGTARTGAYFSIAPFFGAALSIVLLGEHVTAQLLIAGGLMAVGVWLHLTEHHSHEHTHVDMEHEHEHVHDEHHQHEHGPGQLAGPGGKHRHRHRHEPVTHRHAHYPDAHHRHPH